ncbi:hypothetical protein ACLOJK_036471 [Asimina triloba]
MAEIASVFEKEFFPQPIRDGESNHILLKHAGIRYSIAVMLMKAWTIGIDGEATLDNEELHMLLRFATDLESEIDFVAALVLLGTADAHLLGSLLALEMDDVSSLMVLSEWDR